MDALTKPAHAQPRGRHQTLRAIGPGPRPPRSQQSRAKGDKKANQETASVRLEHQWTGRTLAGRYVLEELLGTGATAMVFRARHVRIGQPVAVKILKPEFTKSNVAVARFLDEARTLAKLRHPNIVRVHDFEQSDGLVWLAMELIDGEPLEDRRARLGRLTWTSISRIMLQLCAAVQAAHRRGVVHRDIKPGNVICLADEEGREAIKILDFGIAATRAGHKLESIGPKEFIAGTPPYMAPEVMHGGSDERSDVYAAGVVMYELLTGVSPRPATLAVAREHRIVEPPSSRVAGCCSPEIDKVVLRAIAVEPSERFASMRDLADAIRNASPPVRRRQLIRKPAIDSKPVGRPRYYSELDLGAVVNDLRRKRRWADKVAEPQSTESPSPEPEQFAPRRRGLRPAVAAAVAGLILALGVSSPFPVAAASEEATTPLQRGLSELPQVVRRPAFLLRSAPGPQIRPFHLELRSVTESPAEPKTTFSRTRAVDLGSEDEATERLLSSSKSPASA